jgi:NAD(P)-dependent dehydrogenase (short-subunit alcohol dehydrogenase family)
MSTGSRLEGKAAIVTGAGTRGSMPGTGQATSILFARHGARVLLVDLDVGRAEETLAIIEGEAARPRSFGMTWQTKRIAGA